MAGQQQTTSGLPVKASANTSDRLVFIAGAGTANSNTCSIALSDLLNSTPNLSISLTQLQVVSNIGTPANSSSTSVPAGVFWTDGSYFYYSTGPNHVKRILGNDF